MNYNDLQVLWNSRTNDLPVDQQRALVEHFAGQMRRRRRFQRYWMTHTLVWLSLITGLAVWLVMTGKVRPAQEWGSLALLGLPWAFAIYFLRRFLADRTGTGQGNQAIADTVKKALSSNLASQRRLKLIAILWLLMVPLLAVAISQLRAAGKVSGSELLSMWTFMGATLVICVAGIALRYFTHLAPQEKQLQEVLRDLQ